MDTSKLLTPAQVAERLQMEPETVQGWLRTGRLKGVKIGRYWRIREEALEEMLAAAEEETARLTNPANQIGPGKEHESWLDAVEKSEDTARERGGSNG